MKEDITSITRGRWKFILEALGVDGDVLDGDHHPCPGCQGTDRFRFDDKDGRGTFLCSKYEKKAGDGFSLLQHVFGWDFKEAADRVREVLGGGESLPPIQTAAAQPKTDPAKTRASLARTWNMGRPIAPNDPVARYLRNRGLGAIKAFPGTLRTVSALGYWHGRGKNSKSLGNHPAMIALVQDVDGKPVGLHRTYLTRDGRKADVPEVKKLMSPLKKLTGSAVRLFDVGSDGVLGLAEGIETALAVHARTGIPVWACISKDLMAAIQLPADIRAVYIFADNDPDRGGQECAEKAAERLRAEGRMVKVYVPPTVDEDWLDIYVRKCAEASVPSAQKSITPKDSPAPLAAAA